MKKMLYPILLLTAAVMFFQTAAAQKTVRMNIERMVSDAAMIVHGTVTNVESSVDPQTNIISTFVTLSVQENFYGADKTTLTLKMVGGKTKHSTLKCAEMPSFTTGEEVITFFYAPSKYGFTSPVGMTQGKFTIKTDGSSGKKMVRNGLNNARLFTGMKNVSSLSSTAMATETNAPVDAEEFSKTIRSLVTILKK